MQPTSTLDQAFLPTRPNRAPTNNYLNLAKASGFVFSGVAVSVAVMNLAMDQLIKAGYLTFVGAPDSDKQYQVFIGELKSQGVEDPQLKTSADELAEGDLQNTLYGTPTQVSQDFWYNSLIAGGVALAVITGLIIAAHCYGYINAMAAVPLDKQREAAFDAKATRIAKEQLLVAGTPVQESSKDNGEPGYLLWFWLNNAANDEKKVASWSYQIIFALEHFFQATKGFWMALGITFGLELFVLLAFNKYLEGVAMPVFNDAGTKWAATYAQNGACEPPYGTAAQCLGAEGNRAAQEVSRAIVVERLNSHTQGALFAAALLAMTPLMYYIGNLTYNAVSSVKCKTNVVAQGDMQSGSYSQVASGDIEEGGPDSIRSTANRTIKEPLLGSNSSSHFQPLLPAASNVDVPDGFEENKPDRVSPTSSV